jgi:hypothetical protein
MSQDLSRIEKKMQAFRDLYAMAARSEIPATFKRQGSGRMVVTSPPTQMERGRA